MGGPQIDQQACGTSRSTADSTSGAKPTNPAPTADGNPPPGTLSLHCMQAQTCCPTDSEHCMQTSAQHCAEHFGCKHKHAARQTPAHACFAAQRTTVQTPVVSRGWWWVQKQKALPVLPSCPARARRAEHPADRGRRPTPLDCDAMHALSTVSPSAGPPARPFSPLDRGGDGPRRGSGAPPPACEEGRRTLSRTSLAHNPPRSEAQAQHSPESERHP